MHPHCVQLGRHCKAYLCIKCVVRINYWCRPSKTASRHMSWHPSTYNQLRLDELAVYTDDKLNCFSRVLINSKHVLYSLIPSKTEIYSLRQRRHDGFGVSLVGWSAWLSGRTSVSGQRSFADLHSTSSWRVTTYVGKPSAIGQPTRPTRPFILSRSINE